MKFSIRFADKIVGALVILALAILIVVIFMLGKNQRWFVRDPQYITYFSSGSGLSRNMAVQYKGFTIGNVKQIELAADDSVEVTFSIYDEHSYRVREGSVVELRSSPIGLGNSFHFYPGREGSTRLEEFSVIPEINSPQATYYMTVGLTDIPDSGDSIGAIISNVEEITKNLKDITEGLALQIEPILKDINALTDQIASPSGTVMSILDAEGPLYGDLTNTISSIDGIIENLERMTDFLPAQLPILLSDLNTALRSAQDVLTAAANNPLLRGGVPQRVETGPGGANPRNLEF